MPPHSMTIKHPSKSGKLNGVSNIFRDLFYLNKYTLITTIHFMVDDVETTQSIQSNVFKKFGFHYFLFIKLISKHSINYSLPNIQQTIIEHEEDWHDSVTYQTSLGIFSFYLLIVRN